MSAGIQDRPFRAVESAAEALARITARAIVIGLRSDILFPLAEQEWLAAHIPDASFSVIESLYGHDGFLLEGESIRKVIRQWWRPGKTGVFKVPGKLAP
jgi:homoserine O-acetyltransferase